MYHARPMLRFVLISVAIFGALNVITISQLIRIHPRRRPLVIALAVICNLMWLFLPWLNARSDLSRAVRATLGPPWFAWLCFVLVYPAVALLAFLLKSAWPSRIFLWATLIAIPIGVYTALVPLDIERVPITIADLPPKLNGARIAVVADLHIGLFTRPSRLRQIFAMTAALSPDIVLLAGDLVDDDPYFVPKLLDGIQPLPPSTPLLAVLGNHEMYGRPLEVIDRLRGSRIRLLVNEGISVIPTLSASEGERAGRSGGDGNEAIRSTRAPRPLATARGDMPAGIWIAGMSDYAASMAALRPNLDAAMANKPAALFPIVLAHQPRAFPEALRRGLPLTLCAHTHGGQFGFRALHWSLAGLFVPYHMGLYRRGASQLYVNTGTGYWLLPWRIGVTPEITLVQLRASSH